MTAVNGVAFTGRVESSPVRVLHRFIGRRGGWDVDSQELRKLFLRFRHAGAVLVVGHVVLHPHFYVEGGGRDHLLSWETGNCRVELRQ